MLAKSKTIMSIIKVKSIVIFLLISMIEVKAETNIIAKNGDTLLKISKQYGVSLKELMHENNFNDAHRVLEGEEIVIPKINRTNHNNDHFIHKVIKGDTLYSIGREYNVKLIDIMSINNLNESSLLKVNQNILIPSRDKYKKLFDQNDLKLASKKVFYHQTSEVEEISRIAKIHQVKIEKIISLNKLNSTLKINPNTKLKIRKSKNLPWSKYGSLMVNWSDWRYLDGNYITQAKSKKNKYFYLAISCDKRVLNNTLRNSYWTQWYFPTRDFEFELINNFCNRDFEV